MAPYRVIEPVDVTRDLDYRLAPCFERGAPYEFRFDGFKEGLDNGIIITVALAGHGNCSADFLQSITIFYGAILATAVRMMNETWLWPAQGNGFA